MAAISIDTLSMTNSTGKPKIKNLYLQAFLRVSGDRGSDSGDRGSDSGDRGSDSGDHGRKNCGKHLLERDLKNGRFYENLRD